MKFTEEKLEKAFIDLLNQEGFLYQLGISILRQVDEVLIEADLLNYLLARYAGQNITINEAKSKRTQIGVRPCLLLFWNIFRHKTHNQTGVRHARAGGYTQGVR